MYFELIELIIELKNIHINSLNLSNFNFFVVVFDVETVPENAKFDEKGKFCISKFSSRKFSGILQKPKCSLCSIEFYLVGEPQS